MEENNDFGPQEEIFFCASRDGEVDKIYAYKAARKSLNLICKSENEFEGLTGLMVACMHRQIEVVKVLLKLKASPNVEGYYLENVKKLGHRDEHETIQASLTALLIASRQGSVDIVKELLLHGAKPNTPSNHTWCTPLMLACENGHIDVVKLLLEEHADVNQKATIHNGWYIESDGWTALMKAAYAGHLDIVKLLLQNRAKPNSKNNKNNTVLLLASLRGNAEIVREILAYHGSSQVTSSLYKASSKGHTDVVRALLEHDISLRVYPEYTAPYYKNEIGKLLLTATENGHIEVVRLLLEVDPNAAKSERDSTLLIEACRKGYIDIVRLLLENGVDTAGTSLMAASRKGHVNIVRLLLEHGANPNLDPKAYPYCHSALMEASLKDHVDVAQLLLENGADPHLHCNGWTALALAADEGNTEVVQLLLQNGVDPNIICEENHMTALMLAVRQHCLKTVQLLLDNKADPNITVENRDSALDIAAEYGYVDILQLLLQYMKDPSEKALRCWEALSNASRYGRIEIAQILLENGAKNHIKTVEIGMTPLWYATENGYTDVVKLLLECGANPNARVKEGITVLMIAVKGENLKYRKSEEYDVLANYNEIVRLLLIHGANPNNGSDVNGETALSWVVRYGSKDALKELLVHKAATNVQDILGWTPLMYACRSREEEVVRLLLLYGADHTLKSRTGYVKKLSKDETIRDCLMHSRDSLEEMLGKTAATVTNRPCIHSLIEKQICWNRRKALLMVLIENGILISSSNSISSAEATLSHVKVLGNETLLRLIMQYT